MIALPRSAITRISRINLDLFEQSRLPSNEKTIETKALTKNLFEIDINDEFLPIYTHPLYTKLFKENSSLVQISPEN